MTFKQWVIDLFKDERGSISIKPVVALIGTLFLCGTLVVNNFKPNDSLVDAVMVITAIGLGADSLDKFSKKKSEEPKTE